MRERFHGIVRRHWTMVAAASGLGVAAILGGFAGCSSSTATGTATGSPEGGSPEAAPSGSCTSPTLRVVFSPMYSAYIDAGGHSFQVPAVLATGDQATWTISDPGAATLAATMFNSTPGTMITLRAAGQLTVTATRSDGACGKATLSVTPATQDDWQIGNQRYNDGVGIHVGPPPGFDGGIPMMPPDGGFGGGGIPMQQDGGSFFESDGGTACTNCHGPTASSGIYNDVAHTPEQTAGFSDDDLIAIITQGVIPDGGYFDPTVMISDCDGAPDCTSRAYSMWQRIHRWNDITSDQYKGMVVYLRAMTPAPQTGSSNFGGLGPPGDGGFGPPPGFDAGTD